MKAPAHREPPIRRLREHPPVGEFEVFANVELGKRFSMPSWNRTYLICGLILISFFAATLRLYKLSEHSFWIDELHTARHAIAIGENSSLTRRLPFLPFAFWLQFSGLDLFSLGPPSNWKAGGISEWFLRLPAAVIGIITAPIFIFAVRRILGTTVAIFVGILVAVCPWHVWMSQCARFYPFAFLLYGLGLTTYVQSIQNRSLNTLALALALFTGSFLMQPLTGIAFALLLGDNIWFEESRIQEWKRSALIICAGALSALMLLSDMFISSMFNASGYGNEQLAAKILPVRLGLSVIWHIGPIMCIWVLLMLPVLWGKDKRVSGLLVISSCVPILVGLISSNWMYIFDRYILVMSLPPILFLAGWGCANAANALLHTCGRGAALAPLMLLVSAAAVSLSVYFKDGYGFRAPWKAAVEYVLERKRSGDKVFVVQRNRNVIVDYYMQEATTYVRLDNCSMEFALTNRPAWYLIDGTGNPFDVSKNVDGSRKAFFTDKEMDRIGMELSSVWYTENVLPHEWVRVYYVSDE